MGTVIIEGYDSGMDYGEFRRGELIDFIDDYFGSTEWYQQGDIVFSPRGLPAFILRRQ